MNETRDPLLGEESEERVSEADLPPTAVKLTELTAELGSDVHQLWLADGYLWWAEQDPDQPAVWEWTRYPAAAGAKLLRESVAVQLVMDRLDDPGHGYADWGARRAGTDLDVLDDLHQVELAALLMDGPAHADAAIRRRMDAARAELARLAMLRADLLREIAGQDWGGKTRAAQALGITPEAVMQAITADNRRREQIVNAARAAADPG